MDQKELLCCTSRTCNFLFIPSWPQLQRDKGQEPKGAVSPAGFLRPELLCPCSRPWGPFWGLPLIQRAQLTWPALLLFHQKGSYKWHFNPTLNICQPQTSKDHWLLSSHLCCQTHLWGWLWKLLAPLRATSHTPGIYFEFVTTTCSLCNVPVNLSAGQRTKGNV